MSLIKLNRLPSSPAATATARHARPEVLSRDHVQIRRPAHLDELAAPAALAVGALLGGVVVARATRAVVVRRQQHVEDGGVLQRVKPARDTEKEAHKVGAALVEAPRGGLAP